MCVRLAIFAAKYLHAGSAGKRRRNASARKTARNAAETLCPAKEPASAHTGNVARVPGHKTERMFYLILTVIAGVACGYALRRLRFLQGVSHTITLTICFMLFVLGLTVGGNEQLMARLGHFGGQALIICTASMIGSAVGGWVVYKYVFKREGAE